MTIFLKKDLVKNNPLFGGPQMVVYLGLKMICNNKNKNIYYVSIDQMLAELFGTTEASRAAKQNMKQIIKNFELFELIKIIKQLGKSEWLIDASALHIDTRCEKYQLIDLEDIRKIWAIDETDIKKMNLINYFCVLMSTLDYRTMVGNYTYNQIVEVLQWTSHRTICEYNKILEQNKVIYIYHTATISKIDQNTIRALPNFYGRYDNKEFIERAAKEYITEYKNWKNDKENILITE